MLADRKHVVPGPVNHQPGREAREQEKKDERQRQHDLLLDRLHRLRVELHLQKHCRGKCDRPEAHEKEFGYRPIHVAEGGDEGQRIGYGEILNPPEEWCMAHFDGDEQHAVKCEKHRYLHQDRQTARERIGLLIAVERHQLGVHARLVVFVALAQHDHFRLQLAHAAHRRVGLVREREQQDADANRQQQNGDAEIAGDAVEKIHRVKHRLGQEPGKSEIHREVEPLQAERFLIIVEDANFLGAGKQVVRCRGDPAGVHGQRVFVAVVHLVAVEWCLIDRLMLERRDIALGLVGDECGEPELAGDAEPTLRCRGLLDLAARCVLHVVVVVLDHVLAERAERSLLKNPPRLIEGRGRRAEMRD